MASFAMDNNQQHASVRDIEDQHTHDERLYNESVLSYAWSQCNVIVKDRKTGENRSILTDASGLARAGEQGYT